MKLLSSIQSRSDERNCQPQQPQQQTLSQSSSATSKIVPDISTSTAASTGCKGIDLNHPKYSDASKPVHPTNSVEPSGNQRTTQQPRGQSTSFLVVYDQQAWPSRLFSFTLTLLQHFNPPSFASATGEESQQNISGLSSFFVNLQSVMNHQ